MLGLEGGELFPFAGPVLAAVVSHPSDDCLPHRGVRGRCLVDEAVEVEDEEVC